MPVVLADVAKLVIQQMNLNNAYSSSTNERRMYSTGVADEILAVDRQIVEAICNNRFHPRRKDFLTGLASAVAHGAQLASRLGEIESVDFVITGGIWSGTRRATLASIEQIEWERLNPRTKTLLEPHYFLDGDTLYHNEAGFEQVGGVSVSVNVSYCVLPSESVCNAPSEFKAAEVDGALARLFNVEGEAPESGQLYGQFYEAELARIAVTGRPMAA